MDHRVMTSLPNYGNTVTSLLKRRLNYYTKLMNCDITVADDLGYQLSRISTSWNHEWFVLGRTIQEAMWPKSSWHEPWVMCDDVMCTRQQQAWQEARQVAGGREGGSWAAHWLLHNSLLPPCSWSPFLPLGIIRLSALFLGTMWL